MRSVSARSHPYINYMTTSVIGKWTFRLQLVVRIASSGLLAANTLQPLFSRTIYVILRITGSLSTRGRVFLQCGLGLSAASVSIVLFWNRILCKPITSCYSSRFPLTCLAVSIESITTYTIKRMIKAGRN